jgi:hypothetical protein
VDDVQRSRLGLAREAVAVVEPEPPAKPLVLPRLRGFNESTLEPGRRHNLFSSRLLGSLLKHFSRGMVRSRRERMEHELENLIALGTAPTTTCPTCAFGGVLTSCVPSPWAGLFRPCGAIHEWSRDVGDIASACVARYTAET